MITEHNLWYRPWIASISFFRLNTKNQVAKEQGLDVPFIQSFITWHMGQSNYMAFTQTFKAEVWACTGKNSREDHYDPSQPYLLIYPH